LKRAYLLFTILLFYFSLSTKAQEGFRFYNQSKNHQRITFKLINNLIVIPLEINGENLSFILDTGVNKTIIFSVSEKDSIGLLNPEKITLRGLGGGEPVAAILSKKNRIKIKGLVSNNETIYVILKDFFDLSSKMGTTIHGIIGYNLLKNFIIKINYDSKKIDFYNPKKYKYKKCRKCEILPIQFYRKKPFVNLQIQLDTVGTMLIKVKMLIDSGGSDAIWLFEDSKPEIKTPLRFFNDILGEGLSGVILGKRSRIPKLKIGNFEIEKPTVSFLDSISTKEARRLKNRNGSIGGNILKRFIVWLDYPNKQVILKKNGSLKKGFNYNMSGLDIVYAGNQLIKEEVAKPSGVIYNKQADGSNTISFATNFTYKFKPVYKIKSVVKNSAADKVGLRAGDIILKINQNFSHSYKLNEIINKFQERDKKKIKIIVERNGDKLKFEFRLEKKV
jgi:hypothetical protein